MFTSQSDRARGPGLAGGAKSLEPFRQKLAEQLRVPRVDIGTKPSPEAVVAAFERQLALVSEEQLLAECVDLARKSTNGVPTTLSWFVGWLERLPTPNGAAGGAT